MVVTIFILASIITGIYLVAGIRLWSLLSDDDINIPILILKLIEASFLVEILGGVDVMTISLAIIYVIVSLISTRSFMSDDMEDRYVVLKALEFVFLLPIVGLLLHSNFFV